MPEINGEKKELVKSGEARKFTSIKIFKRKKYLPRLGKLRLGKKLINEKGKEYPVETDYFVVPPEVAEVFGENPNRVIIMFPSDEITEVIPYCYKKYDMDKRVRCRGDGEVAQRVDKEKGIIEVKCPCEDLQNGKCRQSANIMVILPTVSTNGVYQIDTGSTPNINTVLNAMDWLLTTKKRAKFIPLIMERVEQKSIRFDGTPQKHYPLRITQMTRQQREEFVSELKALFSQECQDGLLALDYRVAKPADEAAPEAEPQIIADEENPAKQQDQQAEQPQDVPATPAKKIKKKEIEISVDMALSMDSGSVNGVIIGKFVSVDYKIINDKPHSIIYISDVQNEDITMMISVPGKFKDPMKAILIECRNVMIKVEHNLKKYTAETVVETVPF